MNSHKQILEKVFKQALTYSDGKILLPEKIKTNIDVIARNAFKHKGVFTVLTTLIAHKIHTPKQDIRKHQSNMKNGFSGRSIDTQYITPTLKKLKLPAMAETGWLTRSLEQPHPYNLKYPGKIQNKDVKHSFLEIIDYVQRNPKKAKNCITYLIYLVQTKYSQKKMPVQKLNLKEKIDIEKTVYFLKECFDYKYKTHGGSKIPVIAFYAIFTILIKELTRYRGCKLKPLGSHTASDKTSKTSGDIEIVNALGVLEESIEIKLGKKIDAHLMRVIEEKIYKYNPKRYCVFSTKSIEHKQGVSNIVSKIKKDHGCQVIINGVLPTLKYYLRLISSTKKFVDQFVCMIRDDSELQSVHKEVILRLAKKLNC